MYVPVASPVAFTDTVTKPGVCPDKGVALSQDALLAAVKDRVPPVLVTLAVRALGAGPPIVKSKIKELGLKLNCGKAVRVRVTLSVCGVAPAPFTVIVPV